MALPARVEQQIAAFTDEVGAALGKDLLCCVLYGSAAGEDWVAGRSNINTAAVVPRLTLPVLEALARIVARHRRHAFASPLVIDPGFLAHARDAFPMELDDIRRQHRLLAGTDLFADLALDPRAIRTECEREARSKLLRLQALFLSTAHVSRDLERLMLESLKSFLVILRHLLGLRGAHPGTRYADVLAAGEAALGPLPTMRRLLAHRSRVSLLARRQLRADFGGYLEEAERIVAAVDALDA